MTCFLLNQLQKNKKNNPHYGLGKGWALGLWSRSVFRARVRVKGTTSSNFGDIFRSDRCIINKCCFLTPTIYTLLISFRVAMFLLLYLPTLNQNSNPGTFFFFFDPTVASHPNATFSPTLLIWKPGSKLSNVTIRLSHSW